MSARAVVRPPNADVPALSLRWEGLVVIVDATTLNTLVRKATAGIREIRHVLIEPEDGRLGLTLRVRKGIPVPFRSHLESLRFKDGLLGFRVADLTVFGVVPIPDWVLGKIAARFAGKAWYYPGERVFVVDLASLLPPELSLQVKEVICENGEVRLVFGPSQYRLDRLIEEMGRDPFDDD